MQFEIWCKHFIGDIEEYVTPEEAPLPGAVLMVRWESSIISRRFNVEKVPEAYIAEDGTAQINWKTVKSEFSPDNYSHFETWLKIWQAIGRNHYVTDTHRIKEISVPYWGIEIESVEQLVELLERQNFLLMRQRSGPPVIEVYV